MALREVQLTGMVSKHSTSSIQGLRVSSGRFVGCRSLATSIVYYIIYSSIISPYTLCVIFLRKTRYVNLRYYSVKAIMAIITHIP